jgi:hypothetical protein
MTGVFVLTVFSAERPGSCACRIVVFVVFNRLYLDKGFELFASAACHLATLPGLLLGRFCSPRPLHIPPGGGGPVF